MQTSNVKPEQQNSSATTKGTTTLPETPKKKATGEGD